MMMRLLLPVLLMVFWPATARADDMRPGYLEVREVAAQRYLVFWKVPAGLERASPIFPNYCNYLGDIHRSLKDGTLLLRGEIMCSRPLAGRAVRLAGLENSSGDALLRYQPLSGTAQTARFTAAAPSVTIATKPGRWQVARTYFAIGVEHILTGYDHLLFVLSLVLLLSGSWRVVATVTAFTVAHSVTLIATTLNLVALPRAPVEAAIALSIVFLAVEIVKRNPENPRLSERFPWVVAFLFGLLHGFGFAGALAEIGLPDGEVPIALLTFNLGVEAGQLIIVAAALATLIILRKFALPVVQPAQTLAAYAIGILASGWLIERIVSA